MMLQLSLSRRLDTGSKRQQPLQPPLLYRSIVLLVLNVLCALNTTTSAFSLQRPVSSFIASSSSRNDRPPGCISTVVTLTGIDGHTAKYHNFCHGNNFLIRKYMFQHKLSLVPRQQQNERVRNEDDYNNGTYNHLKQLRSKRWIVFVDDEQSIRDAVGQLLIDCGYQVSLCQDGHEALRIALNGQQHQPERIVDMNNPSTLMSLTKPTPTIKFPTAISPRAIPDVIISDVRMPIMDGITLLGQIRSHSQLVQVPVILLTAKTMVQDRVAGYNAGADIYLPKPFDPDELIIIIDNLIHRHETLNDSNHNAITELRQDLQDIKYLLMDQQQQTEGGNSVSKSTNQQQRSRVAVTNVFLAPDERQVLYLLCQGRMNKEIGEQLYLSTRRIEQLLTILYRKTAVKNRTELVRWAISTGNVKI